MQLSPILRGFLVVLGLLAAGGCAAGGCRIAGGEPSGPARAVAGLARALPADLEGDTCRAEAQALRRPPDLGGSPAFEQNRVEILGRARGEPLVLVREPARTPEAALPEALRASRQKLDAGRPGDRLVQLRSRHRQDPAALRALLLREGYLFATEPLDALAMVSRFELTDLFAEPEIWLSRGSETHRLVRVEPRRRREEPSYRHEGGPLDGRRADLLFGDRVAVTRAELDAPLHRDLRALADEIGFDRARNLHRTERALVAELRFGEKWVESVLPADGAALRLGCLAADRATRDAVRAFQEADAPRRRALARVHAAVTEQLGEGLRFDRPEGEEGPDRDGQLRPAWATAYFQGRQRFEFEGASYDVFDASGKPWPPQVCVDFVLDSFERASGTWFTPKPPQSERLERVRGRLDFNETGIPNRRAVLAFGEFAESRPDLFEFRRFQVAERIQFGERTRFFRFLLENADSIRAGDVVAIHGLKRDERVHQHALLVEWNDPVTGFPHGLADQMKRPRRRTWEGIMAEAPKRSLLYRARPTPALLGRIDPGS